MSKPLRHLCNLKIVGFFDKVGLFTRMDAIVWNSKCTFDHGFLGVFPFGGIVANQK